MDLPTFAKIIVGTRQNTFLFGELATMRSVLLVVVVVLLEMATVFATKAESTQTNEDFCSWTATRAALGAAGFRSIGVRAGSFAARVQSNLDEGSVPAKSWFSRFQSFAMGGAKPGEIIPRIATTVSVVVASTVTFLITHYVVDLACMMLMDDSANTVVDNLKIAAVRAAAAVAAEGATAAAVQALRSAMEGALRFGPAVTSLKLMAAAGGVDYSVRR